MIRLEYNIGLASAFIWRHVSKSAVFGPLGADVGGADEDLGGIALGAVGPDFADGEGVGVDYSPDFGGKGEEAQSKR